MLAHSVLGLEQDEAAVHLTVIVVLIQVLAPRVTGVISRVPVYRSQTVTGVVQRSNRVTGVVSRVPVYRGQTVTGVVQRSNRDTGVVSHVPVYRGQTGVSKGSKDHDIGVELTGHNTEVKMSPNMVNKDQRVTYRGQERAIIIQGSWDKM